MSNRVAMKEVTIAATQEALDNLKQDFANDGYEITAITPDEMNGKEVYHIKAKDLTAANRPGLELI